MQSGNASDARAPTPRRPPTLRAAGLAEIVLLSPRGGVCSRPAQGRAVGGADVMVLDKWVWPLLFGPFLIFVLWALAMAIACWLFNSW